LLGRVGKIIFTPRHTEIQSGWHSIPKIRAQRKILTILLFIFAANQKQRNRTNKLGLATAAPLKKHKFLLFNKQNTA